MAEQRTTNPSGVRVASASTRRLLARTGRRCSADDSTISSQPLWWPPNKLSGRDLVPYFSRQSREDADAMPQQDGSIAVAEHPLEGSAS